jgi:hypothetical protein
MKTLSRWSVTLCAMGLAASCAAAAGPTNTLPSATTNSPDYLSYAARKTYATYGTAIVDGKEERPAAGNLDIPSKYWMEPIKALRPVRVYTHHYNIVVVQKVSDDVEEGKYIMNPISSYLPQSGDDGFVFSPNPKTSTGLTFPADGVLEFKRTRTGNKPR